MKNFLESSNPALTNSSFAETANPYAYREGVDAAAARATGATMQGIVNKTAMLIGIAVLAGAAGYGLITGPLAPNMGMFMWILIAGTAFIVTLGIYMVIVRNPLQAKGLAPVYAVVQGAFLGAVTGVLDSILASMQIAVVGGLALQAFVITISMAAAMLLLYKLRILKPTRTFVSVLSTLTVGIMIMYLINFLLVIFGMRLPFLNIGSAFQQGTPALIGLGLNAVILIIASLWLIVDFRMIEDATQGDAPKHMEWYCSFALMVTLAWIYFEAVRLAFRVAILLNSRD